jgi:hypothetical protein
MVIGRDYWPTAEDEPRLPYIRAVIKEVRAVREWMNGLSHIFLGGARALAVLDGYTPLFYCRLRVQWDVHSQEHRTCPQLLRYSSQRREVSRLVCTCQIGLRSN